MHKECTNQTRVLLEKQAETNKLKYDTKYTSSSTFKNNNTKSKTFVVTQNAVANETEQRLSQCDDQILLHTKKGRVIRLSDKFQPAYAATIWKLQGNDWDHVVHFSSDFFSSPHLMKNFGRNELGTTVSRARKSYCYLGKKPREEFEYMMNNTTDICSPFEIFFNRS